MRRCTEFESSRTEPSLKQQHLDLMASDADGDDNGVSLGHHHDDVEDQQMDVDFDGEADVVHGGVRKSTGSQSQYDQMLIAALACGSGLQSEFGNDERPEVKNALNDTFALIAYTDARDSVLGDLMEGTGRVEIAEAVNSAILGKSVHQLWKLQSLTGVSQRP